MWNYSHDNNQFFAVPIIIKIKYVLVIVIIARRICQTQDDVIEIEG